MNTYPTYLYYSFLHSICFFSPWWYRYTFPDFLSFSSLVLVLGLEWNERLLIAMYDFMVCLWYLQQIYIIVVTFSSLLFLGSSVCKRRGAWLVDAPHVLSWLFITCRQRNYVCHGSDGNMFIVYGLKVQTHHTKIPNCYACYIAGACRYELAPSDRVEDQAMLCDHEKHNPLIPTCLQESFRIEGYINLCLFF